MPTRIAATRAALACVGLSVVLHAGALGLALGSADEPVRAAPLLVLRTGPATPSLPGPPFGLPSALGDLEPVDWSELIEECDGRRFARAREVPDCQFSGPESACRYGPDVPWSIGDPWTIGIGPSGEGCAWAREARLDDAGIVTLSPGEGTDGVFLVAGGPPAYPGRALRDGRSGRVEVRIEVGADGRTVRASIARSSGHAALDEAAAAAALEWTWSRPGPWTGRVVVRFRNSRRPPP
jgi:TonB family protein